MTAPNASDREFDIVVYGATGFVGVLIAEYLATHAPAEVKVALAGRSADKLAKVRDGIPGAARWPLITADSSDLQSLSDLASRTKVVLTTVGPYLLYGLPLVEACATHGTHYVDLTGEVLFMRHSIDRFDGLAQDTGARIIHSCGFDSIPSDLGVLALHEASLRDSDGSLGDTRFAVVSLHGGVSGGTVASMFAGMEAMDGDPVAKAITNDPYALSPDRSAEPTPGDGPESVVASFDTELKSWVSPFIMAMVNTRVVRRSNALLDYAYSKDFRYRELMAHGAGPQGLAMALAVAGGTAVGTTGAGFGPTRSIAKRLMPKPGSGPDEKTRTNGRFAIRLASRCADGRHYRGLVAAHGDPGYAATSMMISQCALALVLDGDRLPQRAGVLTPATGLGSAGIDRLVNAGMSITAHRQH